MIAGILYKKKAPREVKNITRGESMDTPILSLVRITKIRNSNGGVRKARSNEDSIFITWNEDFTKPLKSNLF